MIKNNPMKNPETVKKVKEKLKGKFLGAANPSAVMIVVYCDSILLEFPTLKEASKFLNYNYSDLSTKLKNGNIIKIKQKLVQKLD